MTELDFSCAYKVEGYEGVAWLLICHPRYIVDDDDNCNFGAFANTERVVAHMIGDNREFEFEIDEITPISEDEYCSQCGQMRCNHG